MANGLKKPKSPVKKVKMPDSASKTAATTKSVLELAKQAGDENQRGTKRTTGGK